MKKITNTWYDVMGMAVKSYSVSLDMDEAMDIRDTLGRLSRKTLRDAGTSEGIPAHALYFKLNEVIGE